PGGGGGGTRPPQKNAAGSRPPRPGSTGPTARRRPVRPRRAAGRHGADAGRPRLAVHDPPARRVAGGRTRTRGPARGRGRLGSPGMPTTIDVSGERPYDVLVG